MREKHARHAGEYRAQDEHEELVARDIHAHCVGRLLAPVDRPEGAPHAGINQVYQQYNAGHNQYRGDVKILDPPRGIAAHGQPAGYPKGRQVGYPVRFAEQARAENDPVHDDPEAQGRHCEVMAFQFQDGYADEKGDNGGYHDRCNERGPGREYERLCPVRVL